MNMQRIIVFIVLLGGAGVTMWALSKRDQKASIKKEDAMEFTKQIDGLEYHILNHGTGDTTPEPGQVVDVHYTGWLDNGGQQGAKFDSSVDRGRPFSFVAGAGQVIKGWDETILQMREGEKRYIILDPELGYGARGAGPIPPNAKLRFEVELLKIHD